MLNPGYSSSDTKAPENGIWNFRSPRSRRYAAAGILRGSSQDRRGVRARGVLRLSSRRASCDAARHGAFAERLSRRAGATNAPAALRPDGVRAAALSSAPPDRGNLHARSDERRTPRTELWARRLAARDRIFRRRSGDRAGHLCRGRRTDRQRHDLRDARFSRQAFFVQRRADVDRTAAKAAPAFVVWRPLAGQRRTRGAPLA